VTRRISAQADKIIKKLKKP